MDEFKVPTLPVASTEKNSADIASSEDTKKIEDTPLESKNFQPNVVSNEATCPYKTPQWSADPSVDNLRDYKFEVLKSGQIIDEVKQLHTKPIWKFGRLPNNDIEMAHPTISRFHAVLQYRPSSIRDGAEDVQSKKSMQEEWDEIGSFTKGWYIYDLGSTHGTFLNKQRIPPKTYCRIKVGHMLRLGASTRCFILQGPSEDEEPESELSVTELREQRQKQEKERSLELQLREEARERENEQVGVNWGMMEDADEETDLTVNPFASTNNEDLFLEDPKRTLRGFFEREGLELVYKCDEMSAGSFVCRVELPLDDSNGRPIVIEVVHKGKKKESVVQCALEACRTLDRYGVLRQANQEPLKRKTKSVDSDDDDDFLDRTGDVERKKLRKTQAGVNLTLTYEDLLKQETDLLANIQKVQTEINECLNLQKRQKATEMQSDSKEIDLDSFMENLDDEAKGKKFDKIEVRKLRMEEQRFKVEHSKLQRLLKLAKPFELPNPTTVIVHPSMESKKKNSFIKQQPMIGKRNQFTKFKLAKPTINASNAVKTKNSTPALQEYSDEEYDNQDAGEYNELAQNKNENVMDTKPQIQEDSSRKTHTQVGRDTNLHHSEDINRDKAQDHEEQTRSDSSNKINKDDDTNDKKVLPPKTAGTKIDDDLCDTDEKHSNDSYAVGKKRRYRQRVRSKRTDIEELVAHESADKYAKWVPPDNQTGDGITELNEKFGY